VQGTVWAQQTTSERRQLTSRSLVFPKDIITTEKNSLAKIIFTDNTQFDLSENTVFEVSRYQYDQNSRSDAISTRLLKGTFRFISGLIAKQKPDSMEVNLPVATIGIRGTHVVGESSSTYAKVILLETKGQDNTSIEVFNQFGSVMIDQAGYGTEVPDEFSPPSPVRRMQLRTIDNLIRSIQQSQRVRVPRPR
jgi:hypothetical protein